ARVFIAPAANAIARWRFAFAETRGRSVSRRGQPARTGRTFVEQARSLALIGPPGAGKTMLTIRIATKHIQLGATARFITAQHLANQLGRSSTSLGRQRLLK